MKINRFQLSEGKKEIFEEDIDFSSYEFNPTHIRSIPFCHAKIEVTDFGEIMQVIFNIKADVIAVCSYSLEDVPLHYEFSDELEFSNEYVEEESIIYEPNNIVDLDPHILSLILSRVPIKVVKKGATLPKSGEGYRILTEEEYEKEKANKKDDRWNVLDSVKLDDPD